MSTLDASPPTAGRTPGRAGRPADDDPPSGAEVDPAAARAAMVAELERNDGLRPGPVRDALLTLPREVLMPQAYVRRGAPGEEPPRWELLDWSVPQDRPELLGLLYGGASVLVQHDGEALLGRGRGTRSGASITSMSTVVGLTASLLQELELRAGQRVLDVGTGAGVTAAVACRICGDQGVVTLDRDRHLTDAAAVRLADLGLRPGVVCGSGDEGCPARAPFDRIFVSYAMQRVPAALVEQLAPGGRLLAHITSASPSWPALAVVERTADGQVTAELRAVEFAHRAGHGMQRIRLDEEFRQRIADEQGSWTQRSMLAPPADTDRGLWLAADHLLGGLVRDFGAEPLSIGAPGCGSWLRVEPVGRSRWDVTVHGPRDIWKELQDLAIRWRAAGSPGRYRLLFEPDGRQRAVSACGRLSWHLPLPRPLHEGAST
ncbi:protein-L-isoaspartate O-methyltransferase [Streptomyces adustus]|uniref:Protein-L-isoaspartate O-methyltransferase n=1 Tax=Streptomyces adustus TaxID=1609272 RepID=A0A5N8V959_9ACTN|nr:protein-L-isoaspartate O-methyltransferase [Streptomyces adustus]MPY31559.1 protein-L-isoaspartate O-methyltransferase [Streptomyces adustus]